jgi:hypothetical protein
MEQPRRQRAVVGQQEKPRGLEVETADRVEPLADAVQQPRHRRPALGIRQGAHHAARLVQHDRPPARRRDRLPIDRDAVGPCIRPHPELVHDAAVDAHPSGPDQRFGRPA